MAYLPLAMVLRSRIGSDGDMRLLLERPTASAEGPKSAIEALLWCKEEVSKRREQQARRIPISHADSNDRCQLLPWFAAQHQKFSVQGCSLAHSRFSFTNPTTAAADITNFAPGLPSSPTTTALRFSPLLHPYPAPATETTATATHHGRRSNKHRRAILAPPQAYAQPRPPPHLPAPQLLQR